MRAFFVPNGCSTERVVVTTSNPAFTPSGFLRAIDARERARVPQPSMCYILRAFIDAMRVKRELRLNMHPMKAVAIAVVLLLVVVNALELLPAASAFQMYLSGSAVVLSLVALIAILAGRGPPRDNRTAGAEAVRPAPVPTRTKQADAEIVSFLATLQARGRLVDFLMDDINAHNDAQVGAAARVVHAGCKTVLLEHFRISPVRPESEGSTVQVAAGYSPDEYRLLGKISGPAPFSGVLVHHGWKTDVVNLPRVLPSSSDRLPAIAPAEVELR
jgi:Domain of unknown function (DUF2760)